LRAADGLEERCYSRRMKKPYLTKVAYGRWWVYRYTRRKWKARTVKFGWWIVVASYKVVRNAD
jgi:hypothetical protein